MNWLIDVKNSIPEHSLTIADMLVDSIENSLLDEIDAHACAYAAALGANNGELAFEISMNGILIGSSERELVKRAAPLAAILGTYQSFLAVAENQDVNFNDALDMPFVNGLESHDRKKFLMYLLAAAISMNATYAIQACLMVAKESTIELQVNAVAKIASVISSIGKIAI